LLVVCTALAALACGGGTPDSGILGDSVEFGWVGRCDDDDFCEKFDGNQFDPFGFKELNEELPGHQLILRAEGPGEVEVVFNLGPENCGCDSECELPEPGERKKKEFTIELDEGPNFINLNRRVKKWYRDDIKVKARLGDDVDRATAGGWPMCL